MAEDGEHLNDKIPPQYMTYFNRIGQACRMPKWLRLRQVGARLATHGRAEKCWSVIPAARSCQTKPSGV